MRGAMVCSQALIFIKVRADFASDKAASGLEMVIPFPKEVQRVSCDFDKEPKPAGTQSWDWQEKARRLVWKFKKVQGGSEHQLRVRIPRSTIPAWPADFFIFLVSAHGQSCVYRAGGQGREHQLRVRIPLDTPCLSGS